MEWDIIISKNASRSRFNIEYPYIKPFFVTPERLSYGVTTINIEAVSYTHLKIKIYGNNEKNIKQN